MTRKIIMQSSRLDTHMEFFNFPIHILLRISLHNLVEPGQLINEVLVLQRAVTPHSLHRCRFSTLSNAIVLDKFDFSRTSSDEKAALQLVFVYWFVC